MENLLIINKSNVFKFAELMKYGQNPVKFESDEVMELVKKQTETINEMLKLNMFRIEELVDNVLENGVWVARKVPGYYSIIYANRENRTEIPVLSDDDLNIVDLAIRAQKNREGIKLNINEKMYPKAKKVAKDKNIKFKIFDDYQYFDGKQKSTSIYAQIEQALFDGLDSVSFSKSEAKPETVRVHACSIGKFNHKKLSVAVEGECIVVYMNNNEKLFKRVQEVFDDLVANKPNDYKNIWLGFLAELNPEVSRFVSIEKEIAKAEAIIPVAEDVSTSKDEWSDIEEQIRLRDLQYEQQNKIDDDDEF